MLKQPDRHDSDTDSPPKPFEHLPHGTVPPDTNGAGALRWDDARTSGEASALPGDRLYSLDGLREAFDAAEDQEPVVERLAWPGRITLLAGRDSVGKSTLVGSAVACVTKGQGFLTGARSAPGNVLYLGLDEAPGDLAKRLVDLDVPSERFRARIDCLLSPLDLLEQDVRELEPDLIVVDSLTTLARHPAIGRGNAVDWTGLMTRLRRLLRLSGAALILIHHSRKSDGRYRGSTEIAACADVILEMFHGRSETERRCEARGRWPMDDFTLEWVPQEIGYRYRLVGPEGLENEICHFLRDNRGASQADIRSAVRGRNDDIHDALQQLEEEGRVVNRGGSQRHEWFLVADAAW